MSLSESERIKLNELRLAQDRIETLKSAGLMKELTEPVGSLLMEKISELEKAEQDNRKSEEPPPPQVAVEKQQQQEAPPEVKPSTEANDTQPPVEPPQASVERRDPPPEASLSTESRPEAGNQDATPEVKLSTEAENVQPPIAAPQAEVGKQEATPEVKLSTESQDSQPPIEPKPPQASAVERESPPDVKPSSESQDSQLSMESILGPVSTEPQGNADQPEIQLSTTQDSMESLINDFERAIVDQDPVPSPTVATSAPSQKLEAAGIQQKTAKDLDPSANLPQKTHEQKTRDAVIGQEKKDKTKELDSLEGRRRAVTALNKDQSPGETGFFDRWKALQAQAAMPDDKGLKIGQGKMPNATPGGSQGSLQSSQSVLATEAESSNAQLGALLERLARGYAILASHIREANRIMDEAQY